MGVQVGEGGTQIIYSYNRLTWTDGVAPPPLVSVSGVVDSPYRGLGAFEERDAAFFFGREAAATQVLERMSRCAGRAGPAGGVRGVRGGQVVAAAGGGAAADARGGAGVRAGVGVLAVPGVHPRPRSAG